MYTVPNFRNTTIQRNDSVEGETIETKMERVINQKEPIKDGAPIIYIERKEGVRPSTNIRTDRFEVAIDAMDKVAKSYKARREERAAKRKEDSEAKSISGDGDTKAGTDQAA